MPSSHTGWRARGSDGTYRYLQITSVLVQSIRRTATWFKILHGGGLSLLKSDAEWCSAPHVVAYVSLARSLALGREQSHRLKHYLTTARVKPVT
jgi:hypothetical protein